MTIMTHGNAGGDGNDPRGVEPEMKEQNFPSNQEKKPHVHAQHKQAMRHWQNPKTKNGWSRIIMDEYLLCSALNRDISPPSSLPTALICLPMAWQISLPAAICAFSPSKPPSVARSMKDTQRREYTASTCVCVAFGWDTRSSTWDRNVAKLRSSHWPPSVVTNTTYAWGQRRGSDCDEVAAVTESYGFMKGSLTCVTPTRTSRLTEPPPFSISPPLFRKPDPPRRKPVDISSSTSSRVARFTFWRMTGEKDIQIIKKQNDERVCLKQPKKKKKSF